MRVRVRERGNILREERERGAKGTVRERERRREEILPLYIGVSRERESANCQIPMCMCSLGLEHKYVEVLTPFHLLFSIFLQFFLFGL